MKTISIFLALMNSLMAGVIIAFGLSGSEINQVTAWWTFAKIGAAFAVIGVSLLMWLENRRTIPASLMWLSSLFLAALGAATAVWTVHLAIVSGDMEFYMIVYGGSLMLQGAASLFGSQSRNIMAL